MSEKRRRLHLHHRGRLHQIPIYLGKQFRSFLYMNDWKMLPMAAVIAALVAMVIRKYYFITMEGTLMSSFALTCVAIWNGCFNSIQVICRERAIIKREHRSGMHISSYIISNMVYQAVLCLAQTAVTMYVCIISGVKFPAEGFMTPSLVLDIGISVFLVSYASDMLSLLVSSIAHSTTAAMTVMPFVLIFQLVFSGSIFSLPAWAEKVSAFTISHYGLTAITSQADYNNQPMKTGWDTLQKLQNNEIKGTVTLGDVIDLAKNGGGLVQETRERAITIYSPEWLGLLKTTLPADGGAATPTDLTAATPTDLTAATPTDLIATGTDPQPGTPVDLYTALGMLDQLDLTTTPITMTVNEMMDLVLRITNAEEHRDLSVSYSFTVGEIMDVFGRDALKEKVVGETTKAMYNSKYARTESNIIHCWKWLVCFSLVFAFLAMISLEFIDHDKR